MALGYDGKLYVLAFDHRGSFQKKMFGIEGDPTDEQTETIADAKRLIFEGMLEAVQRGVQAEATGVLVDEQFGSGIPKRTRESHLKLAMPVEKSGQEEFDFQYGEQFGEHIESFDPDFSKVLVRYNPDDNQEMNQRQLARLKELADWLHDHDRKFLFELLVPGSEDQMEKVSGDSDRYDAERLAEQTRSGEGREGVVCVLLGRGASSDKVEHWLEQASPVQGFIGFAIGRSIWWDALKGFLAGDVEREAAASQIADNYLHFVQIYEGQTVH